MKARKVVSGAIVVALALAGVMTTSGMASAEEEVPPAVAEVVVETPAEVVPEPVVEVVEAPPVVVEVVAPAAAPLVAEGPAEVAPQSQPDFICNEAGYEAKVDWDGDGNPTVIAPEGFLIDSYCVKAGTTKHIVAVTPPAAEVVIDHPIKDSVSHYQVHLIPIPDEPTQTSLSPPVVKDLCGTVDDHYGLPEAPEGVTITRDGKDLIATLAEGYVVTLVPEGWVADGEGVYRYAFNPYHFTDVPCEQGPSCTTVTGAQTIVGDGVLTVDGGWDTTSINVPFSGTLADIGTVLDVTASDTQYLGLHIDTAEGTIVFEEEPSYGGNLWSESAWDGVGTGMGYAAFGSIEEYIAQNGDVVVTGIRLLYTHPEASSTTVESFTIGCTVYTFEEDTDAPVPALYSAQPEGPTCDLGGTFSVADGEYVLERITVWVERGTDEIGDYVLIEVLAHEGYTLSGLSSAWEVNEAGTYAYRYVDLAPAIGYQSVDSEAPCFRAPGDTPVSLTAPIIADPCGSVNDDVTLPANTAGVVYTFNSDDVTVFDVRATVQPGFVVETVPAGWTGSDGVYVYAVDLTNTVCTGGTTPPGTTPSAGGLASTGGGDVAPYLPIAGGLTLLLGAALVAMTVLRRRQTAQV